MKLLHITAHLGGGVGNALSTMAAYCRQCGCEQQVVTLEPPEKDRYAAACMEQGIPVTCLSSVEQLGEAMGNADVVVLSWWDHPIMAKFLAEFPQIPVRLVMWCHVNGCTYPYLPFDFASRAEHLCFTTPYSYDNPYWTRPQAAAIKDMSRVVYGMGELTQQPLHKTDYCLGEEFRVGYVGTLNYAKLHPDFPDYCRRLKDAVPQARFVLVGDLAPELAADIERSGLEDSFEWIGYSDDVPRILTTFDAFGYILNPDHFGATENALLEAMCAGLPVVALNQSTERYIVRQGETGLLADSPAQYVEMMRRLCGDRQLRKRLGENGRAHVLREYSMERNAQNFMAVVEKCMGRGKKQICFSKVMGKTPYDWFVRFMNVGDRAVFTTLTQQTGHSGEGRQALRQLKPVFLQQTKSSVFHYHRCYPYDEQLRRLAGLLSGHGNDGKNVEPCIQNTQQQDSGAF